jgi:hypothetical protein
MGRGFAWLDTGTASSLLDASEYVATIERRQGLKISCPEEIALRLGFVTFAELQPYLNRLGNSDYATYVRKIALVLEPTHAGSDKRERLDPSVYRTRVLLATFTAARRAYRAWATWRPLAAPAHLRKGLFAGASFEKTSFTILSNSIPAR